MPSTLAIDGPATAAITKELRSQLIKTSRGVVETATWGEGPAVLSLHGAMGGCDQGILLAQTVTYPRFRYVAVSRPGYLGTRLSMGKTPQGQADLCAEVLDQLGVRSAAVIAISGGGPTALQFALRHAKRCRGLVMISACSDTLDVPIPFRFQIMKLLARIPGATNTMRKKMEKEPEKAASRSIADKALRARVLQDPETAELFFGLQRSVLDRMVRRLPGTENDIRQTRAEMGYPLEEISVPTLVVHGTSDSLVPFVQAKALASRVPAAELLMIEGGEHASIFTHRAEVRATIDRFLATHAM
jgi:pimeloyl-ACP methyl ester carboxylesterase